MFPDVAAIYKTQLATQDIADIPADLAAALQSMAAQTKHFWSAMTRAGVPEAPIYATGGWARCPALMQQRANVFGEPIMIVDEPELVALGAALFAAQAAGAAPTFSAAEKSHIISTNIQLTVTPAKAGAQLTSIAEAAKRGPGLRRDDGTCVVL